MELCYTYTHFIDRFCDGIAVLNKKALRQTLQREISIFSAKAHAIDLLLALILKSNEKNFIIFVCLYNLGKQNTWKPLYNKITKQTKLYIQLKEDYLLQGP